MLAKHFNYNVVNHIKFDFTVAEMTAESTLYEDMDVTAVMQDSKNGDHIWYETTDHHETSV